MIKLPTSGHQNSDVYIKKIVSVNFFISMFSLIEMYNCTAQQGSWLSFAVGSCLVWSGLVLRLLKSMRFYKKHRPLLTQIRLIWVEGRCWLNSSLSNFCVINDSTRESFVEKHQLYLSCKVGNKIRMHYFFSLV
jgi:hypothetical protein